MGRGLHSAHDHHPRRVKPVVVPQPPRPRAPTCTGTGNISRAERHKQLKTAGATLWFTGLSASGKSTIACARAGARATRHPLLPPRRRQHPHGSEQEPGFLGRGPRRNIRRIGGLPNSSPIPAGIALTSFISPYRADRDAGRATHEKDSSAHPFIEVFVDAPIDVCEQRPQGPLQEGSRPGRSRASQESTTRMRRRPTRNSCSSPRPCPSRTPSGHA